MPVVRKALAVGPGAEAAALADARGGHLLVLLLPLPRCPLALLTAPSGSHTP